MIFVEDMKGIIAKSSSLRRVRVFISLVVLSLCVIMITACSQDSGTGIIIAGSTSVQPYAEVLAEEYVALNPDSVIDIQGGGSSAGITAVQSQTADIGMSSRSLEDGEKSLWQIEIAKDGLVLIVHPDNKVEDLSLDQIRGIYTGAITQWNQVGGEEEKIHLITREEGSGTRSAFTELVMGEEDITPKAIVQDSNGSVMQIVQGDPNAIGYVSLGLIHDDIKALHLDGVEAIAENIRNGSYALARPFLFVAQDEPTGETKGFIEFILSEEGQKLLSNEGLIPSGEGIEQ